MRSVMGVPPDWDGSMSGAGTHRIRLFSRRRPLHLLVEKTCWPVVRDLLVCCAPLDATPREFPLQSPECYRAATAQRDVVPGKGLRDSGLSFVRSIVQ